MDTPTQRELLDAIAVARAARQTAATVDDQIAHRAEIGRLTAAIWQLRRHPANGDNHAHTTRKEAHP